LKNSDTSVAKSDANQVDDSQPRLFLRAISQPGGVTKAWRDLPTRSSGADGELRGRIPEHAPALRRLEELARWAQPSPRSSFARMWRTCISTVLGVSHRFSLRPRSVSPWASSERTSRSRAVRSSVRRGVAAVGPATTVCEATSGSTMGLPISRICKLFLAPGVSVPRVAGTIVIAPRTREPPRRDHRSRSDWLSGRAASGQGRERTA